MPVNFINSLGETLVSNSPFLEFEPFSEGMAPVRLDLEGNWGFCDIFGNLLIKPLFSAYFPFQNGLAPVAEGEFISPRWNLINEKGSFQFKRDFHSLHPPSEGSIALQKGGNWFLADLKGDPLGEKTFVELLPFSEKRAPFREGELWGYLNQNLETHIPPQFLRAFTFSDGWAVVGGKKGCYLINWEGERGLSNEFHWIFPLGNQKWGFFEGEKIGLLNSLGDRIIPPTFDKIKPFQNGLAMAQFEKRWGFINPEGDWVISPTFDQLGPFGVPLLAPAQMGGLWGFISEKGDWALPPQFQEVTPFHQGVAMIQPATFFKRTFYSLFGHKTV